MKTNTTQNSEMAAQLSAALPLHDGETLLWYRQATDGNYELRVRTADGFEGMHDVYADQLKPSS